MRTLAVGVICLFAYSSAAYSSAPGPVRVRLESSGGSYVLTRGGQPYWIQGAGGQMHLDLLKTAGGNSIRTWGADDLEPILDRAQELGLSVAVGIWLGQERQGFRYDNEAAVQGEFNRAKATIERYRNHPAVLVWGLGNEMEGEGTNPRIWKAIDNIAAMAKQVDPNHPTMTVIAGSAPAKLAGFQKQCPHVDILGINVYGGLAGLPEQLQKAKFKRPYIVTEFGPTGHWEVAKTPWGAAIEPGSTQKAGVYAKSYEHSIASQKGRCLGSYVFLWGQKQEVTPTWYGMFLASGEKLEPFDVMTKEWSGKWPENRCPRIQKISSLVTDRPSVKPSEQIKATAIVDDPDGDPLFLRWEVRSESHDRHEGGDREGEPVTHPECVFHAGGKDLELTVPPREGSYRLFLYAYDGQGNAATMNIPFLVKKQGSR